MFITGGSKEGVTFTLYSSNVFIEGSGGGGGEGSEVYSLQQYVDLERNH